MDVDDDVVVSPYLPPSVKGQDSLGTVVTRLLCMLSWIVNSVLLGYKSSCHIFRLHTPTMVYYPLQDWFFAHVPQYCNHTRNDYPDVDVTYDRPSNR